MCPFFFVGWLVGEERVWVVLRKGVLDVPRERAEMAHEPRVSATARGTKNGRRRIARWWLNM